MKYLKYKYSSEELTLLRQDKPDTKVKTSYGYEHHEETPYSELQLPNLALVHSVELLFKEILAPYGTELINDEYRQYWGNDIGVNIHVVWDKSVGNIGSIEFTEHMFSIRAKDLYVREIKQSVCLEIFIDSDCESIQFTL
jgi:hypothetical protein